MNGWFGNFLPEFGLIGLHRLRIDYRFCFFNFIRLYFTEHGSFYREPDLILFNDAHLDHVSNQKHFIAFHSIFVAAVRTNNISIQMIY
jgi:hypothetical protein